jgi:integrase
MKGTYTKRGNRLRAEIMVNGQRKSKTFDTKRQAQAWVAESVTTDTGVAIATGTLRELCERYKSEVSETKRGEHWEVIRLDMYARKYEDLFDRKLTTIQREDIERVIKDRLKQVKPSTVNRDLNLIGNVFKYARRWRMMSHNPMTDIKRPKDPEARNRRVLDTEIEQLLVALNYSDDLPITSQRQKVAIAFLIALETAMRQGEIAKTKWSDVHIDERYIFLPHTITKTAVSRNVPLSARAIELIGRLDQNKETMLGVSAGVVSTMFRAAVANCGIDNLTFHDARHEATTRLAGKLQVLDLARVTGHRDIKQLMTYYNKDARELAGLL